MKKTKLNLSLTTVVLACSLFSVAAIAADTSKISSKPKDTVKLKTGTYDFKGRTIDGSGVGTGKPLFSCNKQAKVTIKNITVTNNPRYALFIRSCDGLNISNFTMKNMSKSTGGIRFDKGYASKNVTIGTIKASNVGGHALELWDVNGYSISKVNASSTKGCGVLVNRSKNGKIGTVTGNKNAQGGGYATLRFANNNGKVTVNKVKSRNSGRGFFSVSGSSNATVKYVDISGSTKEGIYIQDAKKTKVLDGKSRGNPNCRIRGGSGNSIKADCGGSIAK
ncbi:right-handed parallel beta-helix repeat-containing protein [Vibrio quintilis]|uniref:Right handed beta helix domain-containing protein n=1 Tax=Vibrio quintilis TaxID=1117707 RepID=A0A1M7YUJ6_9VIBR|nr:right-handed parallel beta-helix repeat-containing protein [Vibrio quintilis]SHO56309.1 hypothetical protein VQ7734_02078 [Vibrio quintilis]